MADEPYDELIFKTVNGDEYRKRVPAGQGEGIYQDLEEAGWIDVGGSTRIRKATVVSVRLAKNASSRTPHA